jgi:hypothetical protein
MILWPERIFEYAGWCYQDIIKPVVLLQVSKESIPVFCKQ